MKQLQTYRAERFAGGANSYGGQGICSRCHQRPAEWMGHAGCVLVALCDHCIRTHTPCTCRLVVTLPDGTRFFGGIDDCPVHGFTNPQDQGDLPESLEPVSLADNP